VEFASKACLDRMAAKKKSQGKSIITSSYFLDHVISSDSFLNRFPPEQSKMLFKNRQELEKNKVCFL